MFDVDWVGIFRAILCFIQALLVTGISAHVAIGCLSGIV